MNPAAQGPPQASSSQFSPSASPLHPHRVMHNVRVLSSLSTLAACFSGAVAGVLGLTNLWGFALYLVSSLLSALSVFVIKCKGDIGKYVPQAHGGGDGVGGGSIKLWKGWVSLLGLGQENLLGFLLFWIGSYALIHVYD